MRSSIPHPPSKSESFFPHRLLTGENQLPEAESLIRQRIEIQNPVLGADHPEAFQSINALADVLFIEGKLVEAGKQLRQTIGEERRAIGPDNPYLALSTHGLGTVSLHHGRKDDARSLFRGAIDRVHPPLTGLGIEQDPDLKSLPGDPRFDALGYILNLPLQKLTQNHEEGLSVPSLVRPGFTFRCNPLFEQIVLLQIAISFVSFA
jgi:hypothetical protein